MKLMQKKNKKGITLVESVIAVVLLGFAATGILTMLIAGGTKIFQIGDDSSAYAEATQRLDRAISAISNSRELADDDNIPLSEKEYGLALSSLNSLLDYDASEGNADEYSLTATPALYDESEGVKDSNIRGWYLTLTYQGVTVKGFASNSKGDFDRA